MLLDRPARRRHFRNACHPIGKILPKGCGRVSAGKATSLGENSDRLDGLRHSIRFVAEERIAVVAAWSGGARADLGEFAAMEVGACFDLRH